MRKYGTIGGVDFLYEGFDIYNVSDRYKLTSYNEEKTVYVNNMKDLKVEIATMQTEELQELPQCECGRDDCQFCSYDY